MAVDVGNINEKIGPLPAWAWGGLIVGIIIFWRHHANVAATATTPDPATDNTDTTAADNASVDPFAATNTSVDPLSQLDVTNPAFPVGATAQGVPPPITNAQWGRLAANYLMAHGDDPALVQSAIAAYLNGASLSVAQQSIINQALTAFGSPPEGVLAPVAVTASGSPSTATTSAPATPHVTGSTAGHRAVFSWGTKPASVLGYFIYRGKTLGSFTLGTRFNSTVQRAGTHYGPISVVALGINGKRSAMSNAVTVVVG